MMITTSERQQRMADIFDKLSETFYFTKGLAAAMRIMRFGEERLDEYKGKLLRIRLSAKDEITQSDGFDNDRNIELKRVLKLLKNIESI